MAGPAFPFYHRDFDFSTAAWPLESVGAYVRLLSYQWDKGAVPSDPAEIAAVLRVPPRQAASLWLSRLAEKFPVGDDGQRRNAKLEEIRAEQEAFIRRQSEKGRAGAAARWQGYSTGIAHALPTHYVGNGRDHGRTMASGLLSESGGSSGSGGSHEPSEVEAAIGGRQDDRRRARLAELDWRTEETWAEHVRWRARFFKGENGHAPVMPTLTKGLRKIIREAIERHDGERLSADERERWKVESPVRAAGKGIFLSTWHAGTDKRNDITQGGRRFLEPERCWKPLKGVDPVPTFAELFFEEARKR